MNRFFRNFKLLKQMNLPMTIAVGLLMIIGVLFIYSACYVSEEQPVRTLYRKQIVWMVAGALCYVLCAVYDYRRLGRFAWWLFGAAMFLLVAVLFVGTRIYGARRWLMVFGVGIQPSEVAKLATAIALARLLSRPGTRLERVGTILMILALVIVPVALVMKEPDLGTAMVFLPLAFAMVFVAGMSARVLGAFALVGLAGAMILAGALFLPAKLGANENVQKRITQLTGLSEYQKHRLVAFLHPGEDPLGVGWNKNQSEIAVGSGGRWGKGFLKGTQNVLGFLPRSVAPTDFIYSVIAEEKGFFGSAVVLLLFCSVCVSGMRVALMARDKMGRLLCVGIVSMVFTHVFVNIAMTVGLLPITGLPLPLLSYGGSFMIVTMSSLGIVQSIYIRSRHLKHVYL